MLSLFKLPFWGKNGNEEDRFPTFGVAQGVFRNFTSRKTGSAEQEDGASEYIKNEFEALHQLLDQTPEEKRFDLIQATLRRVDQKLTDL